VGREPRGLAPQRASEGATGLGERPRRQLDEQALAAHEGEGEAGSRGEDAAPRRRLDPRRGLAGGLGRAREQPRLEAQAIAVDRRRRVSAVERGPGAHEQADRRGVGERVVHGDAEDAAAAAQEIQADRQQGRVAPLGAEADGRVEEAVEAAPERRIDAPLGPADRGCSGREGHTAPLGPDLPAASRGDSEAPGEGRDPVERGHQRALQGRGVEGLPEAEGLRDIQGADHLIEHTERLRGAGALARVAANR
jgi:hypothetical protein